jgi:hypothetical protein
VATAVMNPTLKDIQWLVEHPQGEGMVVSCYADVSVAAGIRPLWREHLKDEAQRIEQTLAHDPDAIRTFRQHIEMIRATLSSPAAAKAHGMAVFVQGDRVRAFVLATPVANRLVVDEEPYLVPLLERLHRQRRYLVVHTDTHRGRLYTATGGPIQLIKEISENVPKRQRSAGELWGKEQATIARHREDHILHYLKELVREIERAWPEERYRGIVLLGEHEVLAHLRPLLPDHLAREVVHEAPHAWVGKQQSLSAKLAAVQDHAMRRHDERIIDEVRSRLHEHHRIAAGPQEVIDAFRNSQVGYPGCVVMEPDRGGAASRCTGCGSLFVEAHDRCPFCQSRCEKVNLWQEIALLATRHQIPVHFVGAGLEQQSGIVALLARDEPWAAPTARERLA